MNIQFIKTLNKRQKVLVLIIAALSLLFIFKLLIFDPLREKLSSVEYEIKRAQLVVRKYLELGQHQKEILEGQKQIERYLNLKGSDDEKKATILSRIEAEARKAGLLILDMNPVGAPDLKAMPVIYRVQLRAEADMAKACDFIYNLENADILFKIEKIDLSAKEGNPKVLKIEASILGISLS